MRLFSNAQGQLTPQSEVESGRNPIKNEGATVLTRLYIYHFFRPSRAGNSAVGGGIPPNFELI